MRYILAWLILALVIMPLVIALLEWAAMIKCGFKAVNGYHCGNTHRALIIVLFVMRRKV